MSHKHEKDRLKRIKLNQNLAKAKRRVYDAYANQAGGKPDHELFADPNIIINVVKSLSRKTLKLIANYPDNFIFPRKEELYRLAIDAVAEDTIGLEKTN